MTSVDAFADLFLAQLGNARPGRASLASIIARLTSDEDPTTGDTGAGRAARTWELDPAEGILGSRWSRARRGTVAAVAGAASTVMAWAMLATVQAMHPVARAITALGIGITAAVAPAIGSALAIIGWLVTIVSNTPFIAVVPVAALGFAVGVAWWLVWGRAPSASSAVFCLAAALAAASGSGSALAGIATGVAGFFLPAPRAATSMAAGAVFSHLLAATLFQWRRAGHRRRRSRARHTRRTGIHRRPARSSGRHKLVARQNLAALPGQPRRPPRCRSLRDAGHGHASVVRARAGGSCTPYGNYRSSPGAPAHHAGRCSPILYNCLASYIYLGIQTNPGGR